MGTIRLTQATAMILRALATGHHHGFQIMDVTGLPSGTVYPVLRRLEKADAVQSTWEDEEEAHAAGRPRRRVYGLTDRGMLLADQALERLANAARLLGDDGLRGTVPGEGG